MKRIGMWLAVLFGALTLGAAEMYVAPAALGTGDGYTAANAAAWTDKLFWTHAQQRVKQGDTTVHFAAGTYLASKSGSTTVCLQLSKVGTSNHTLTLLGAEGEGTVLMRDPSESTEQTAENRMGYILNLTQCTNVVVDNLHFTGPGALNYAFSIRTPYNIVVRNCSWTNMTGIYYGTTGSSTGGSGITFENCLFDTIGVGTGSHCIYNAYDVNDILIRNCVFRDCYGDYVRFRDNCHRCTVDNCTFEATGKFRGYAFIACPLYNDEDPALKPDPADHEYFSQNIAIRNCTFIGLNRPTLDAYQYVLDFLNNGYNPVGKHYHITQAEAAALETMPADEARAWMRERLDIDLDALQWVNNTIRGAAGTCRYRCMPNYGAESEYPRSIYHNAADVTRLLHMQQDRAAQLPEETRAVWIWNDSLTDGGRAVAAKLKVAGVNTVYLIAKSTYGDTPWNSSVSLAPDTSDSLATYLQTFHDYGISVHLWFVCHGDLAWVNAHPEDRLWHFGKGGDPARLTSGNGVCPISNYRAYLLSLIREVVSQPSKYPIEGLHIVPRYTYAQYCFCPAHTAKAAALGIDVDNVRAAVLAGFGADGKGDGEAYYNLFRAGDPDVTGWVAMREAEVKELGEAVAAILAEYQPGLILSLSAAPESALEDDTVARCQYGLNLAAQGSVYDLVCPLTNHTDAGQPASWCTDLAVRAAVRSGVPALTGMGGSDDAAAVIADSRARGGSAGFGVFRYETMESQLFTALGAATTDGYAGDLDNNGRSDVMMVNAAGNTGAWITRADDSISWFPLSTMAEGYAVLDFGYSARAKSTPDIYIYNATTGVVGAWLTGSLGVTGWLTVGSFDPSTTVVGIGDFNGDGISDLLLRSAAGDVGCWLGGTDESIAGWRYFQSLGPEWTIQAIGDLDGDGISDIVLTHELGYTGAWLIRSLIPTWSDLGILNGASQIAGCGDFDGDGTDDILIRIGTVCGAWMIRNGSVTAWRDLGMFSGTVEEIVDVDNDGISDLRVRTYSGDLGWFRVPQTEGNSLTWHYFGSVGSEWTTSHSGL